MRTGGIPDPPPEIPDSVRDAARDAPDHWLGVVDPQWPQDRPPPDWAVVGEWRSDEEGDVREYRANPRYRPSAQVLGWPKPTDPVDAAAQRAATGYGSVDEALAVLADAEVTVVRGADGRRLTAAGSDGKPVVLVFTSPAHQFMSPTLIHETLPAGELVRELRGSHTSLMVNATAAAPLVVPADSLPVSTPPRDEDTGRSTDGAGSGTVAAPAAGTSEAAPDISGQAPWPHTTGRTP